MQKNAARMPPRKQFDYFFLSYFPDIALTDSACLAFVLLDSETGGESFCRLETVEGWKARVKRCDPDADVKQLQAIVQDIDHKIIESQSRSAMLALIENSFSNSVRASTRRRCEAEHPEELLEKLSGG